MEESVGAAWAVLPRMAPHRLPWVAPVAAKAAALLLTASLLAGCAGPAVRPPVADPAGDRCLALFAAVDAAVEQAGVGDAEATRVAGFPYLRVDRLLASLRFELPDPAATRFWLERLAELDAEARSVELANLPAAALAGVAGMAGPAEAPAAPHFATADGADAVTSAATRPVAPLAAASGPAAGRAGEAALRGELSRCRTQLVAADAAHPGGLAALRDAARVPDDYSTALRVAGLYAFSRIPFAAGVRAFEREVEAVFALPLERLPVRGRLERFAPPAGPVLDRREVARLLGEAAANPLGLPYPRPEELRRLAAAHAPVLEIDVADDNDRIGAPQWPSAGPVRIDTARPHLFYRAARTRLGDRVLLQLVYTAWFPARPLTGRLDLLGGHLDALVWRVTLAPDGEPLVFDSIHACGCYHFFFPTAALRPRPHDSGLDEWLFVPRALPRQTEDERVVLRLASGTHYLERVRFEPRGGGADATAHTLALAPEDGLRSLPHPGGGRRSLYGPDGFVAGSERAERFVFWPMGVRSPGAMRQWGRHATAFVGRRHFDDPWLMDARFAPAAPAGLRPAP